MTDRTVLPLQATIGRTARPATAGAPRRRAAVLGTGLRAAAAAALVLVPCAALSLGGCASRTPAADRIVYEVVEAPDQSDVWAEAPRTAVRDDVPESVRREWWAKNGPNRGYAPAKEVEVRTVTEVRDRRRYVDRGYRDYGHRDYGHRDGGYYDRDYRYDFPARLSLGYFGFRGRGHGRHHHGFGYGLSYGWPYW